MPPWNSRLANYHCKGSAIELHMNTRGEVSMEVVA